MVTREPSVPVTFTVRRLPSAAQFRSEVRDEALRLARGYGQKHHVDVWYRDGATDRLLERHRHRGV